MQKTNQRNLQGIFISNYKLNNNESKLRIVVTE